MLYPGTTSGTVILGSGEELGKLSCLAGSSAGTVVIDGTSIPVPALAPFSFEPNANDRYLGSTIVFTGMQAFYVEGVKEHG